MLEFSLLGDALRDVLEPRLWGSERDSAAAGPVMQNLLGVAPLAFPNHLSCSLPQGTPATVHSPPILSCLLLLLVMVWIIGYYSGYCLLIDDYASLSLTCA